MFKTRWNCLCLASFLAAVFSFGFTPALAADLSKVVIIKTDDFKVPNQAWTNFLQVSRAAGIKVSIGIIVSNIVGKAATTSWIQAQQAAGDVEFWNHGWDHVRWTDGNGQSVSEFQGIALATMRQHLTNAQAKLKTATGRDIMAVGTPYNGFDTNTAAVMNATPALRLFFSDDVDYARSLLDSRVHVVGLIREDDGTGLPNAAKFAAAFPPGTPGPISLQFHPPNFTAASIVEYQKIVQYLLTNGYSIRLPSEYVASLPPTLVSGVRSGSNLDLIWCGGLNTPCTLLTTTNLTLSGAAWTSVATNQAGADGLTTNRVVISGGILQRFYRLSIPGN